MTISIDPNYYNIVANIESGGNPYAVSGSSSASGLYGFLNSTRNALQGSNDTEKMFNLTQQNASVLSNNGLDISNQNLYAAHFLGAGTAVNVLSADNSTPLSDLISRAAAKSNPQISNMNVGQFKDYTAGLTAGHAGGSSDGSGPSTGDLAMTAAKEGGEFAVDIASGNYVKALSDGVQDILGVFGIGSRKPGGDSSGDGSGSSSGNNKEGIIEHYATRFSFIIIGIVLVIVAAVYLAANSDAGKTVINNVKEVGKTLATTAVVAA